MKIGTAVIPARYDSVRFPGKPLAKILGKPMIQWVYEGASTAESVNAVIIATDDNRIFQAAEEFGAPVRMTSASHTSGTSRVSEVAQSLKTPIIINIQGDEPLIEGRMIDILVESLQDPSVEMSTLAVRITDMNLIHQEGIVKVVIDKNEFALYFSRSPLPFKASDYFWRHIGIYGYQKDFLLKYPHLPLLNLEKQENLEQLRALEHGFKIKVLEIEQPTLSVDHPEDIAKAENMLNNRNNG